MNSQTRDVGPRFLLVFIFFLCLGFFQGWTQTNISGVINTYTQVTALDLVNNTMTVNNTAGFASGDLLMIIQMQGAAISTANSTAFGNVTNYNGAGNYELAILCEVDNNDFIFENTLVNTGYAAAGNIQIVRVPQYTDATVTATLTGQAWNGTTGGVLALAISNTLLLNADINMDGMGFRGGAVQNSTFNCNFTSSLSNYAYNTPNFGGKKGEGIAAYIPGSEYGRGAQANGGGGGNDHNTGGAGGANGGLGGFGGINDEPNFLGCNGNFPGRQGKLPVLTNSRIFMGGGGGAGHGNNNLGSSGANGGGIILIIANTLQTGTSNIISADGNDANNSMSDGAGAGGAGGSIHLEVNTFTGALVVRANGGNGGNTDNENLNRCFGPGGGGSGGVVKANPALPGTIVPAVAGGTPGVVLLSPCSGSLGATAGGIGTTASASIPVGTVPDPACGLLPVSWLDISIHQIDHNLQLSWSLSREYNNDFFTVERSTDGRSFTSVYQVDSKGNSLFPTSYKWMDPSPVAGISYYRVKQTNLNGIVSYSETVNIRNDQGFRLRVYPNPLFASQEVKLELDSPKSGGIHVEVFHITGKRVFRQRILLRAGRNKVNIPSKTFSPGTYLVRVFNETVSEHVKLVVR